jgi:hypothetical protein
MRKLVLHHRYADGAAWDVSGFANHGQVVDAYSPGNGALRFSAATSRVDVPASPSLGELGSLRCAVTFCIDPKDHDTRYNFVEAGASFALYLDYGQILRSTIYQGGTAWPGVEVHAPQLLDGNWHRVDCGHDGLSTGWLAIDGHVVQVESGIAGPIRPLNDGVTIGHWPGSIDQDWTMTGDIGEVWLWRWWPDPPFEECCRDPEALARVEKILARYGVNRQSLPELRRQTWAITAALHATLDANRRVDMARTAVDLEHGVRMGNWARVIEAARHASHLLRAGRDDGAADDAAAQLRELYRGMPDDPELRDAFAGLLCAPPPEPDDDRHRPRERRDPPGQLEEPALFGYPVDQDNPEPGYPPGPKPTEP